jgi:hypothetical protein
MVVVRELTLKHYLFKFYHELVPLYKLLKLQETITVKEYMYIIISSPII